MQKQEPQTREEMHAELLERFHGPAVITETDESGKPCKRKTSKVQPEMLGEAWLLIESGKCETTGQAIGAATLKELPSKRKTFSDVKESGDVEGLSAVSLGENPEELAELMPRLLVALPESFAIQLEDYLSGEKLDLCPRAHSRAVNKLMVEVGLAYRKIKGE